MNCPLPSSLHYDQIGPLIFRNKEHAFTEIAFIFYDNAHRYPQRIRRVVHIGNGALKNPYTGILLIVANIQTKLFLDPSKLKAIPQGFS
tara:strand:- start:52 stop:318 length:267 start_codon:yes stop_codon:yes gene_type:complete